MYISEWCGLDTSQIPVRTIVRVGDFSLMWFPWASPHGPDLDRLDIDVAESRTCLATRIRILFIELSERGKGRHPSSVGQSSNDPVNQATKGGSGA
jgi:hypothetical protein